MHIPEAIVRDVLEGAATGRGALAVNKFGSEENVGLVILVNVPAFVSWTEWFLKAAETYKAEGNIEQHDALKGFFDRLTKAYHQGQFLT